MENPAASAGFSFCLFQAGNFERRIALGLTGLIGLISAVLRLIGPERPSHYSSAQKFGP